MLNFSIMWTWLATKTYQFIQLYLLKQEQKIVPGEGCFSYHSSQETLGVEKLFLWNFTLPTLVHVIVKWMMDLLSFFKGITFISVAPSELENTPSLRSSWRWGTWETNSKHNLCGWLHWCICWKQNWLVWLVC